MPLLGKFEMGVPHLDAVRPMNSNSQDFVKCYPVIY
jgi:hypothetical protein